jgi:hypothetical protein
MSRSPTLRIVLPSAAGVTALGANPLFHHAGSWCEIAQRTIFLPQDG